VLGALAARSTAQIQQLSAGRGGNSISPSGIRITGLCRQQAATDAN